MIDSHCHLEFRHFDKNREKVIRESKKRIKGIVDSCARIKTADMVLELHEKHPNFIFPSLGLHPKQAVKVSEKEVDEYKGFIEKNRKNIVAVGEVGLDYYHVKKQKEREKSKEIFLEFIKLSESLNLPLVIHSRNSMKDTLDILKNRGNDVIIHCFSGNMKSLEEVLDRNYYLSFGGIIFRSEKKYQNILKKVPLENLLLETDAPFLAKKKRERSKPWFIREIAEKLPK